MKGQKWVELEPLLTVNGFDYAFQTWIDFPDAYKVRVTPVGYTGCACRLRPRVTPAELTLCPAAPGAGGSRALGRAPGRVGSSARPSPAPCDGAATVERRS